MPTPYLASRASARVFPSSSCSEISPASYRLSSWPLTFFRMLMLLCRGSR